MPIDGYGYRHVPDCGTEEFPPRVLDNNAEVSVEHDVEEIDD